MHVWLFTNAPVDNLGDVGEICLKWETAQLISLSTAGIALEVSWRDWEPTKLFKLSSPRFVAHLKNFHTNWPENKYLLNWRFRYRPCSLAAVTSVRTVMAPEKWTALTYILHHFNVIVEFWVLGQSCCVKKGSCDGLCTIGVSVQLAMPWTSLEYVGARHAESVRFMCDGGNEIGLPTFLNVLVTQGLRHPQKV